MNYPYYIITDDCADLPKKYFEEAFDVVPMSYFIDGKPYQTDNGLPLKEFYDKMRDGAMPTTSLANANTMIEYFTPALEKGCDVLFVSLSSALSGNYKSALEAKEVLSETYPERKIYVLDSKCASGGQGLLVFYCLKKRREGMSFDDITKFAEQLKEHVHHDFTVDNLMHLYHGGRVSKTAAIVGTAMQVKPILIVNTEGKLIPISKVVGRKTSIKALVDKMEEKAKGYDNSALVYIGHGDCEEDAIWLKQKIEERFGYTNVDVNIMGSTVGSHLGPDSITLFYLGIDKEK